MSIVYICHHIDTEGPLWENIQELFDRIKHIFDIDLKATYSNLEKLQKGEISLPKEKKDELLKVIDPHSIGFKRNWGMIEEMLERVMSPKFRDEMHDSFGNGWIYNWHIMDHVGFNDVNPRHRDIGFHNIYEFYNYMIASTNSFQDSIHWHFHPVSITKKAHIPATCYDNCMPILHQIISRRLIDKNSFPVVNRAGFHTERFDSNLFLEQWIPFDPSNQSVNDKDQPKHQKDLGEGRFGDWRGAPSDWSLYHPDLYDWRKTGNAKRVIGRVLNMKSRHRNINETEIEKAFVKAKNGENVYLGITNHDWREMSVEIDEFRNMLSNVSRRYPGVKYKFSETVKAFQNVLGFSEKEMSKNKLILQGNIKGNMLKIEIKNGEIFGPQPYLAFKTKNGDYFHDNFDFGNTSGIYTYTFDNYTMPLNIIEKISVASNDKYGNTSILHFNKF